jgi:glycosyltransferase involved in cell wall biosynthesis
MSSILAFLGRHPLLRRMARAVLRPFPGLKPLALTTISDLSLWGFGGVKPGGLPFDPKRPTIVLCTHEASVTGAPILGWNLAHEMSKTHNLVCVLLMGGELADEFRALCCGIVCPDGPTIINAHPGAFHRKILVPVARDYGLDGIIINSVECAVAAAAAQLADVPRVVLLHEFAEYTSPERLHTVLTSGATVVFSSKLVEASARRAAPGGFPKSVVLPQGRCDVPQIAGKRSSSLDLSGIMGDGEFLCIGLGAVQPRKGVDLFIAAAIQMFRMGGSGKFVWVGDGYDPMHDHNVGIWLRDEIERSGYGDRIRIVPAVGRDDLDRLYARADAMFLSSRLDPLPNVAIDALSAGVPVVCFESATGLAEYLREDSVLGGLVVPYFDTRAAAEVLLRLQQDGAYRADLAGRAKPLAARRFDMAAYVGAIEQSLERGGEWPAT